jgi:hypothetical protein
MNSPIDAIIDYKPEYNNIENITQHIFTKIDIDIIIGIIVGMVIGYFIGKSKTHPSIIINNIGNQNIHQPLEPISLHDEPYPLHDEPIEYDPLQDEPVVADDEHVVAHDEPEILLDDNVNNPWSDNEQRELLLAFDNKGHLTKAEVSCRFARLSQREIKQRTPFYGQKCYVKLNYLLRKRSNLCGRARRRN